jgi:dolichol-phosphate mannosyltransferase
MPNDSTQRVDATMSSQIHNAPDGPLVFRPILRTDIILSVVIPTFREKDNIGLFLSALCESLDPALTGRYEIIVVDDDSPDGTLEAALQIANAHPQIRLTKRYGKHELAISVIRGWQSATGAVLATINADFQHPPELIAEMWNRVQDSDLVVASRYCAGGGVGDWPLRRRAFASVARFLGIVMLPAIFRRVSDPLSGCFMFRREVLAEAEMNPIGFKSLVEVLVHGKVGAISECPYNMHKRRAGSSKATFLRSIEYIVQLCRLRAALEKAVH